MKRRRPPASSEALKTDLRQVLAGILVLALCGLSAGAAISLFDLDGPPGGGGGRLVATAALPDGAPVADAPGRHALPLPRAEGPPTTADEAAAAPQPPAAPVGGEPAAEPPVAVTGAVTVAAAPGSAGMAPAPGTTPVAAPPAGAAAQLSVPKPRSARLDIDLHRLEPRRAQLAALFLGEPGGERRWRRVEDLLQAFGQAGYDLHRVRRGETEVPRIFLAALPDDMRAIRLAEQRKRTFIKAILPLILRANEAVAAERRRLKALLAAREAGRTPAPGESAWMAELAARYGGSPDEPEDLLRRVDTVPISLALAQAAEESGWGTSRFARQGNAVFGQWTWDTEAGIVPRNRPRGRNHLVRKFPALQESVSAYLRNLNSNPAYSAFRKARAQLRSRGEPVSGRALAGHLTAYSERGPAYVGTLRTIMSHNDLDEFDGVRLADTAARWTARLAGETLRSVF